jgi:hypothetical protein
VFCFEHEVQVSTYGFEVNLSLCLYLQIHTFERIVSLYVQQFNWCWNQHGDKSLQSAACTGIDGSVTHNRYVCTLQKPWTHVVFITMVYDILTAGSTLITNATMHHIVSSYNSAHIFITISVILHCIAYCSHIHNITVIHIFKNLCSDQLCSPQSVQYISLLAFPH